MRARLLALVLLAALAFVGCGGDGGGRSAAAGAWESLSPAPLARTEVAAARVGRFVYVIGGFERESGATTAATERYDVVRDRWTRVADLPVALNHAAAASYRGDVYVVGGYRGARGLTQEVATRKPRGGIGAATVGGRIVVVGGEEDAGTIREVELFDPRSRRWRRLPGLPTPRHGLGVVARRGRVYTLAGGDEPGFAFTSAVEALKLPR